MLGGLIEGLEGTFKVRGAEVMEGQKEGQTSGNSPLCFTGHHPFWAAAQKGPTKPLTPAFFMLKVGVSSPCSPAYTGYGLVEN